MDDAMRLSEFVRKYPELLKSPDYERRVVEIFVTELVAGIPFYAENSLEMRILLDLCYLSTK
ncbi:MAG: hypothetical protein QXE92_00390 [Thermofilaceae archaeon]